MNEVSLINGHIDEPVTYCEKCKLLSCEGCELYEKGKKDNGRTTKV